MTKPVPRIILASRSPRREELLAQLGVCYQSVAIAIDETPDAGESAEAYVQRVAAEKSCAGLEVCDSGLPVLAADTEVVLDGEILGKPRDLAHATTLLSRLAGSTHRVLSAVSLRRGEQHWSALSVSSVTLRELSLDEIEAYWASGEPCDKAGAYAIQGRGALFISHIEGSYSGVMGLPLFETARLLTHVGIDARSLLQSGWAADE